MKIIKKTSSNEPKKNCFIKRVQWPWPNPIMLNLPPYERELYIKF